MLKRNNLRLSLAYILGKSYGILSSQKVSGFGPVLIEYSDIVYFKHFKMGIKFYKSRYFYTSPLSIFLSPRHKRNIKKHKEYFDSEIIRYTNSNKVRKTKEAVIKEYRKINKNKIIRIK